MKNDADSLKKRLEIDPDKPIPADYSIPYYIHQEDMNRIDLSHRKSDKWHYGIICGLILLFVLTNLWWIYCEYSRPDSVTVTQETPSGNNSYIGRDGDINISLPEEK